MIELRVVGIKIQFRRNSFSLLPKITRNYSELLLWDLVWQLETTVLFEDWVTTNTIFSGYRKGQVSLCPFVSGNKKRKKRWLKKSMVVFQRETKLISCQRSLLSTTSSGRKEKNFISAFSSLCSLDFLKVSLSLFSRDQHWFSSSIVTSRYFLSFSFAFNRQKAIKDTNSSRRGTDKDRKISNKTKWKTTSKKRENQRNKKEEIEQKHSRKKTKTLNQSDINYHSILLIWCILRRRKSMNNNKFTRILRDIKSE